MKFSARAAIGGVGTAVLCAVFPPITLVAVPVYGIACIAGKQRDRRLEDSSDSSESGDYGMNSMVRRNYESPVFRRSYEPPPYMRDIIPLPDLGLDIRPEAVIARSRPRLAASILSKQIAASIIETGSNVIAD